MITRALPKDADVIKSLIDFHAKRSEMLPRSLGEIYEHLGEFLVRKEKGKVLGCCALRITWKDLAEIRSLAVDPGHKGKGMGAKLVKACLREAKAMKIPRVFTLTNKPEFFKKLGFKNVSKEKLPMKVWGECVRCSKYLDCDEVALAYDLKNEKG